jgi:CheY-like chemotaxis protein/anti-sigma regulatory factor (Ser/Thr protein kinase)
MDAVSECLSLVEAAAHERDVRLLVAPTRESQNDEPVLVDVDPSRLRQVILNLLDNAVKYNRPGGSVRLHVEVVEGRAILEVHDEGRGISEEGRDRVFEPFERLDASLLGVRGSGLGLSVARSLARAMSGDVQLVSSRPGHTIFRVTMLASDESMPRSIEAQAIDPSRDVVGHVLYVEDHPMNALLVRSILEHAVPRVTVEVARSGKEALDILQSRTPELVLLDLHLPDMSGLDVLSQSGIAQRTPVHVVTADVTMTARERAADASVHGYVLKPVSPKALVDCVVSALSSPENAQDDQEGADADANADSR